MTVFSDSTDRVPTLWLIQGNTPQSQQHQKENTTYTSNWIIALQEINLSKINCFLHVFLFLENTSNVTKQNSLNSVLNKLRNIRITRKLFTLWPEIKNSNSLSIIVDRLQELYWCLCTVSCLLLPWASHNWGVQTIITKPANCENKQIRSKEVICQHWAAFYFT